MSYTHVNDSSPIARKRHVCMGCGESIAPGEKYLRRFGFGEYGPQTDTWHFECEQFAFGDGDSIWESSPGAFSRKEAIEYRKSLEESK